jgi:hypothetical protein
MMVAEKLLWSVMVKAVDGPQVAASGSMPVEAYDKIRVTVAAGATQQVDLSPGGVAEVTALVISPDAPDALLTYDVNGTDVALDAPHVLLGGAVALVGDPTSLTFTNGTAADAEITILVARDATP